MFFDDAATEAMSAARQAVEELGDGGDAVAVVIVLDEAEDSFQVGLVADADELPVDSFIGARAGAMATRIGWSPNDVDPFVECWVVTAVGPGLPAQIAIGPYDGEWYRIPAEHMPWFIASTAGSIRASLEESKPMVPKRVGDEKLFGLVKDGDPPPVDEHGLI